MNTQNDMSRPMFSFGYQPHPHSLVSWGARAIFRPSVTDHPLDLLPDRQQIFREGQSDAQVENFLRVVNEQHNIIGWMQQVAKHFSPESREKFCRVFSHSSDWILVAEGSPQSSYGYFYLAISMVPMADRPAEVRPDLAAIEAEKQMQIESREREDRLAEYNRLNRIRNREIRQQAAVKQDAFASKGWCDMVPGEAFVPGMRCTVYANQADRDAVCVDVSQQGALIQYIMRNGKKFLWEVPLIAPVQGEPIRCIRVLNANKLPSRYSNRLPQFAQL